MSRALAVRKVILSQGRIIDANTPCNTHDLLECPCDGANFDDCISTQDEDMKVEIEGKPGFIRACEIEPESVEKMDQAYLQKKKAGLAALGQWKHINCLKSSGKDDVQDDALRKLINFHACSDRVAPQPHRSLNSIDTENIATLEKCLHTREVPGGSISFIFQKSTIAFESEERGCS
ncbi:hypothetical protein H0H93_009709 [Arthromyces matolae]|nr:hypothetical protein H0H93_009709 [Arthromyces matolae]